jgi:aconitate hydratase
VSLLGVKAVIAESFERIHRTNLIGMGVLPLQFAQGTTAGALGLDGSQTFDLVDLDASLGVRGTVQCIVRRTDGTSTRAPLHVGIETEDELHYLRSGGILPAVWREYVGNGTQPARPS